MPHKDHISSPDDWEIDQSGCLSFNNDVTSSGHEENEDMDTASEEVTEVAEEPLATVGPKKIPKKERMTDSKINEDRRKIVMAYFGSSSHDTQEGISKEKQIATAVSSYSNIPTSEDEKISEGGGTISVCTFTVCCMHCIMPDT